MLLNVEHLSFSYSPKKKAILNDVSFGVEKGDLFVILGENGAGKSTLLRCLCRLEKYQGTILLQNKEIKAYGDREYAKKTAFVPQSLIGNCSFSVLDFVVMGRNPFLKGFERPRVGDYKMAQQYIEKLNLEQYMYTPLDRLSGGERQKAYIARALAQEAELLIFDEPTSALDFNNQHRFLSIAKGLTQEGKTVIMTTHNPQHPFALQSKVGVFVGEGDFFSGECYSPAMIGKIRELYQRSANITVDFEKQTCCCNFNKV